MDNQASGIDMILRENALSMSEEEGRYREGGGGERLRAYRH